MIPGQHISFRSEMQILTDSHQRRHSSSDETTSWRTDPRERAILMRDSQSIQADSYKCGRPNELACEAVLARPLVGFGGGVGELGGRHDTIGKRLVGLLEEVREP